MKSIRTECLSKMIFFECKSLDKDLREFITHYNAKRNHQGIGNEPIDGAAMPAEGNAIRDERLGGLLSFYRRAV